MTETQRKKFVMRIINDDTSYINVYDYINSVNFLKELKCFLMEI